MAVLDEIRTVLGETLQLGDRAEAFDASTPLFGSLPEFDSLAVVSVLTAIEERYDMVIEDEEITADIFESVGSLSTFVENKLNA